MEQRTDHIKKIYDEVIRLCKTRPNITYMNFSSCYYSSGKCSDDSVGCIVGQAICNLYPEKQESLIVQDENRSITASFLIHDIFGYEELSKKDKERLKAIDYIQTNQDRQLTWKQSLDNAIKSGWIEFELIEVLS